MVTPKYSLVHNDGNIMKLYCKKLLNLVNLKEKVAFEKLQLTEYDMKKWSFCVTEHPYFKI